MKRIVKKVFAFVLAMTLCFTQLAMPVLADTDPAATSAAPAESTPVTPTAAPAPPQAIAPETPLPAAPADTYDYDMQVTDLGLGGIVVEENETWTQSEVTDTTPDPATVTTDTPPAEAGAVGQGSQTTTESSGNVIVTKDGEQNTTTYYGPDGASQSVTGKEDITTTDTTKTVTTTTDTVMTDTTTNPVQNKPNDMTTGYGDYTAAGSPTESEVDADDKFVADDTTYQRTETGETDITVTPPNGQATLTMKQEDIGKNETFTTDSVTFTKEATSALPQEAFDENGNPFTDPDHVVVRNGENWTVSYTTNSSGDITGVTFTKITTEAPGQIQWGETPAFSDTSEQPTTSTMKPADYEKLSVVPTYTADEGDGTTVTVTLPEVDFSKATDTIDDGRGNTGTRTLTPILKDENDPNSEIIGYKIVDTITVLGTPDAADGSVFTTQVSDITKQAVEEEIPAVKPTPKATKTENGLTTTETVTDFIDANGKTAYRLTTVITDALDGTVLFTEHHDYFAGTKTTQESIKTTPTSGERVITTETIVYGTQETQTGYRETEGSQITVRNLTKENYNLINTENGVYLKYEGKLYKVESATDNGTHGALTEEELRNYAMTSWAPTVSLGKNKDGSDKTYNTTIDLMTNESVGMTTNPNATPTGDYAWANSEFGLISTHMVDTSGTSGRYHYACQFVLRDSEGNRVYAYCMDAGTSSKIDHSYDMDNIPDSGYTDTETSEKIQSIAQNGYWGIATPSSGEAPKGSRGYLAELLKNDHTYHSFTDAQIDAILTDGICLSATQAALWYTANGDDPTRVNKAEMWKDILDDRYGENNGIYEGVFDDATSNERDLLNALFKTLVTKSENDAKADVFPYQATELLDAENFATEVSLTVKEQATASAVETFNASYADKDEAAGGYYASGTKVNSDGTITDGNGNDLYVTNMDFVVDVKQSDLTGNLTVRIVDSEGNTIAKKQLATSDSNFFGKAIAGGEKTQYTFQNLILPSGAVVSLTLDGLQNMAEGAYLYSAAGGRDKSQTFVGMASGVHAVHLSVDMSFTAEDPGAKVQSSRETWKEQDVDTHKRSENATKVKYDMDTSTSVSIRTTVLGTRVATKMVTQKTKEQRQWNSYIEYLYDLTTGDGGAGGGGNDDGTGINIPDEAVPLAAAPKTGDASQIFAAVSLISLSGALLLKKKEF